MTRNLTRRAMLASTAGLTGAAAQNRQRRPNIVAILADDQGSGDLSIHGNSNLRTPNIDSLGRDGALFDRFFVCSVCAPTRAEFLTGRYHARGGVRGVSTGQERLNLDERTIAQTFKDGGYATAAFGKWHNGTQHPYHPNARGFDEYYGFTSGHWGQYFDSEMDHNGRLTRGKGFIIDDLTNHALDFMGQHRSRPFFCYLPFNTPHSPMQVPDRFYENFRTKDLKMLNRDPRREDIAMTRAALAMVENIDWNVGRLLARLDQLGLARDTIVLYFSDNGPNSWRWNGGMKGRKGSLDEGGLRAPLLIRWLGQVRAGARVSPIAGAIDLLPTLADLAGIPVTSQKPLDGRSLKPLLVRQGGEWPDRMLFSSHRRQVSVRTQQFRLDPAGQLFDITKDPGQDRDVADQHPDQARRLKAAAEQFAREVLPPEKDDRPFPVGYSTTTMLPARDGVPAGGVERSARAPNCSYFTNWTTKDGRMTWDVEVGAAGRFDAVIYYTCPASDVGSAVELSFLGAAVTAKVAEAHDPPLIGESLDRVSRGGESYVKDFRPLKLGTIDLRRGRGQLTLRATSIAGRQVADIRYVALTRLAQA
ncbi:MAG: arylsulfatase [Bryobacteraceae bacterium]|nr:arylsulfatase [Bryobacteraceae bacterium]